MNTLRKPGRPRKNPEPETQPKLSTASDSIILEFMRRLNADANKMLAPVFPEEMADPDSAKTLGLAFSMGVRLGTLQLRDMAVEPVLQASDRLVQQLMNERRNGTSVIAYANAGPQA